MIKCLVFDLDDTLYYERTYVLSAFKNVCMYLAKKYKMELNLIYNKCKNILDTYGRGKVFDILCEEFAFEEDIKHLVELYRKSIPDLELYKESSEIIQFAKDKKINLGIITDGCSSVQWNKIKALGLDKLIDKIIVTDDYGQGYSKPHEKSYIDILSHFKCKRKKIDAYRL